MGGILTPKCRCCSLLWCKIPCIGGRYETTAEQRRRWWSGRHPAPKRITLTLGDMRASFAFDPISGRLSYETSSPNPHAGDAAAAVHRGVEGAKGPIVLTIAGGSIARTGDIVRQPA